MAAQGGVQLFDFRVPFLYRFQQPVDEVTTLGEVTARLGIAGRDGRRIIRPYDGKLLEALSIMHGVSPPARIWIPTI